MSQNVLYRGIWKKSGLYHCNLPFTFIGKARRLKQAKEEAQDEIEKYRQEREKQFRDFEAKVSVVFLILRFLLDLSFNI